jgi:hypothetical protein
MLDLDDRFPIEPDGIANDPNIRLWRALEHDVEPVICAQPLGCLIFVGGETDFADAASPFHFDEPDFNRCLGILGMRASRYQIESAVLAPAVRQSATNSGAPDRRQAGNKCAEA